MKKFFMILVLLVTAISPILYTESIYAQAATGLSQKQKELYDAGILYYDYNYATNSCSSASPTAGSGSVFVLGDSYGEGVQAAGLKDKLTSAGYSDVTFDVSQGRAVTSPGTTNSKTSALTAVDNDKDAIAAAGSIVIILGTNPDGNNYETAIPSLMKKINGINANARKFWVNTGHNESAHQKNIAPTNANIAKFAPTFNYSVIDWNAAFKQNPSLVPSGALHPTPTGFKKIVDLIAAALGVASSSTTSTTTATTTSGSKGSIENNRVAAYQFLISKGLTPAQAVGWMANINAESGFNPDNDEKHQNPPTATVLLDGYGLLQWTNTGGDTHGRRYRVFAAAEKQNVPVSDLTFQLNYMWDEIARSSILKQLKAATTPTEAHNVILLKWEQPNEPYRSQRLISGPKLANEYLQKYAGLSASVSTGCDSSASQAGALGYDLSGPNAMVYYAQTDPKWSNLPYGNCPSDPTIESSGCGITSMAMIVSTLTTTKILPPEMAKISVDNGFRVCGNGTAHALAPFIAKKYGLKYSDLGKDFDKAAAVIKGGGLVWVSVGVGTFTSSGHLMVIRKVSADGQSFYLADPFSKAGRTHGESNTKAYTRDELLGPGNLNVMYGLSK